MGSRAYCKSCGAEILWVLTVNGKKMPLSVSSLEQRFIVSAESEEMRASSRRTYRSHYSDCPNAAQHRSERS
jgi:hypothetical protein